MTPLLTRRDRAACVLAYECLRSPHWTTTRSRPLDADHRVGAAIVCLQQSSRGLWRHVKHEWTKIDNDPRILRARLALALRALLRADADDYGGRWACTVCGSKNYTHALFTGRMVSRCNDCGEYGAPDWTIRIRPLWEMAPPCQ